MRSCVIILAGIAFELMPCVPNTLHESSCSASWRRRSTPCSTSWSPCHASWPSSTCWRRPRAPARALWRSPRWRASELPRPCPCPCRATAAAASSAAWALRRRPRRRRAGACTSSPGRRSPGSRSGYSLSPSRAMRSDGGPRIASAATGCRPSGPSSRARRARAWSPPRPRRTPRRLSWRARRYACRQGVLVDVDPLVLWLGRRLCISAAATAAATAALAATAAATATVGRRLTFALAPALGGGWSSRGRRRCLLLLLIVTTAGAVVIVQ